MIISDAHNHRELRNDIMAPRNELPHACCADERKIFELRFGDEQRIDRRLTH